MLYQRIDDNDVLSFFSLRNMIETVFFWEQSYRKHLCYCFYVMAVCDEDITAERSIPFLSVKLCLFAWPSLLLSVVRLLPVIASSPKGDFIDILSSDCQIQPIPHLLSYSFNNLIHILLKMFNLIHYCWNHRWHVEPDPYSEGSIFHYWHPLILRT